MTKRVFELRNKQLEFYKQKNYIFKNDLVNMELISMLAYLLDIFDTLN